MDKELMAHHIMKWKRNSTMCARSLVTQEWRLRFCAPFILSQPWLRGGVSPLVAGEYAQALFGLPSHQGYATNTSYECICWRPVSSFTILFIWDGRQHKCIHVRSVQGTVGGYWRLATQWAQHLIPFFLFYVTLGPRVGYRLIIRPSSLCVTVEWRPFHGTRHSLVTHQVPLFLCSHAHIIKETKIGTCWACVNTKKRKELGTWPNTFILF